MLGCAVRDLEIPHSRFQDVTGEEGAGLPRSQEQHGALGELAEDLVGELHSDRRDRQRVHADFRLGPDAFAGPDRALEEPVEHGAARAGLPRDREGLPDLSEDFALSERHGVEPGRDPEEVAGRFGPEPPERRSLENVGLEPPPVRDEARELFACALSFGDPVDLAPVAGRDDHALRDEALPQEPPEPFADLFGREGDPLADGSARSPEIPAEQEKSGFAGVAHRKT